MNLRKELDQLIAQQPDPGEGEETEEWCAFRIHLSLVSLEAHIQQIEQLDRIAMGLENLVSVLPRQQETKNET